MKLYLLSNRDNQGYDKYDSCIVCAKNREDALTITPDNKVFIEEKGIDYFRTRAFKKESIGCEEIGIANGKQER